MADDEDDKDAPTLKDNRDTNDNLDDDTSSDEELPELEEIDMPSIAMAIPADDSMQENSLMVHKAHFERSLFQSDKITRDFGHKGVVDFETANAQRKDSEPDPSPSKDADANDNIPLSDQRVSTNMHEATNLEAKKLALELEAERILGLYKDHDMVLRRHLAQMNAVDPDRRQRSHLPYVAAQQSEGTETKDDQVSTSAAAAEMDGTIAHVHEREPVPVLGLGTN